MIGKNRRSVLRGSLTEEQRKMIKPYDGKYPLASPERLEQLRCDLGDAPVVQFFPKRPAGRRDT